MAHIRCHKDDTWYSIETGRNATGPVYKPGSLLMYGCPFPGVPLELGLAVTPEGELLFRHWEFCSQIYPIMQVDRCVGDVHVTASMVQTLRALMEGKLLFDGLKLPMSDDSKGISPTLEQTLNLCDDIFSCDSELHSADSRMGIAAS